MEILSNGYRTQKVFHADLQQNHTLILEDYQMCVKWDMALPDRNFLPNFKRFSEIFFYRSVANWT